MQTRTNFNIFHRINISVIYTIYTIIITGNLNKRIILVTLLQFLSIQAII